MKTYVVNLARSNDRRAHMLTQLRRTRLDYEIVEAVDGRKLDLSNTELFDPAIVGTSTFRPGAAGCALSHLDVYRRVLNSEFDKVLILEDDVMLPDDLNELAEAIGPHMGGAEVVLLNFHSREPCRVTREGSIPVSSSRLLVNVIDEDQPSSTGGYLITKEACVRLVRLVLPLRVHPDDWGFFHREGAIDRVRCVVPMPIVNSETLRTTIDYYRPGSIQARVRESVASARVPVLSKTLAFRRRRTFQRWGWTGRTEFVEDDPEGKPSPLRGND